MSNPFYNHNDGVPIAQTRGVSSTMRAEFDLIQTGFGLLPTLVSLYTNLTYAVDGGAVNAMTASVNAAVIAYADGMSIDVKISNSTTSVTPTLNVNSIGAATITRNDGTALVSGDILTGTICTFKYNSTTSTWQCMNALAQVNPKLTGIVNGASATSVSVPTAALGDSTTKAASTAYAMTMQSPAFSGTPTVPTAAAGTSTTQVASTAFVQGVAMTAALPNQAGNAGAVVQTNGTTASWSSVGTTGQMLTSAGTGAFTWTLPIPLQAGNAGTILTTNGTTSAWSAAGSTGQILLSGGATAPTWLSAGTSGQVLSSAGAGASPVFIDQPKAIGSVIFLANNFGAF
jgi:hypothetical protein